MNEKRITLNQALQAELLQMQAKDRETRRALIEAGELYGPHLPKDYYHPEMASVHRQNNARLREIVETYGWPGRSLVGEAASEAAWQIAQHAILDPDLQQQCLPLLEQAVAAGEAPARHWAMLTDRVLTGRGEPQLYGSIHIGNDQGELVPWPIADPENVEARRAAVGLPPMAENTRRLQSRVEVETKVQREAKGSAGEESMPTDTIDLVRQWVEEIWNQGQLQRLGQFHPPTFTNHGQPSTIEETEQWQLQNRATFPDVHYTIDDIFAAGDAATPVVGSTTQVAFRWTATATHQGTLWGMIPATGKSITWNGMHMLRVVDQQIVEVWAVGNSVAQLQQMGVTLQPAAPSE